MPTLGALNGKQVIFKVASSEPTPGTVRSTEPQGVWIQLAANSPFKMRHFSNMNYPVVFIPYYQLEFLVTEMTAEELSPRSVPASEV
jgi:hypothetical protein